MRLSIAYKRDCELKSVALGTNEEIVHLYKECTKCFHSALQRSDCLKGQRRSSDIVYLGKILESIREVDKLINLQEIIDLSLYQSSLTIPLAQRDLLLQLSRLFVRFKIDTCGEPNLFLLQQAISFVYQYLIGCMDKCGSKTYSSGSFEFRDIFVSLLLFRGAYVWIKFRQASYTAFGRKRKFCQPSDPAPQLGVEPHRQKGVYRRAVKNKQGAITHYKYEPRFKPPREKTVSGTTLEFDCLSLGGYNTPREAEIVRQIAAFFYGKGEGRRVQLEQGDFFFIPYMSEQEERLSGTAKAEWVTLKTKEVYADLLKARHLQLLNPALETGSHHGHEGVACRNDPSPSAEIAALSAPGSHNVAMEFTCFMSPHGSNGVMQHAACESRNPRQFKLLNPALGTGSHHGHEGVARLIDPSLSAEIAALSAPGSHNTAVQFTCFTSPHGGNGVEQHATGEFNNSGPESIPSVDLISDLLFDYDVDDVLASDNLGNVAGDLSETAIDFGFESISGALMSSALDVPTTATFARLPRLDGGDQGLEIIEHQLNLDTVITFQQLESLPGQVQLQQRVSSRHEEFAVGSNVELLQKLRESELRNSELLRENENLRSMLQQITGFISTCNLDRNRI